MKKFLLALLMLAAILETASAGSLEEKVQQLCADVAPRQISLSDAIQMIRDDGYTIKKVKSDRARIKINGRTLMLYRYGDGDYQLYYGATGVKITYEDINYWNHHKRLARAYLDDSKDAALESDLDAGAGLTKAQLLNFVKVFSNVSVPSFVEFLLKRDKS